MKNLIKLFSILFIYVCSVGLSHAQTTKADKKAVKAAEVKSLLAARNYTFIPSFVTPLRGGSRSLTGGYDVTVTKEKIVTFLPYFGQANVAPMDASQGGIKLTTTNFDYKSTTNKKGNVDILITNKDSNSPGAKDVRQIRLSVSMDGYANMQITALNRDAISFNGYIQETKKGE
jgi:hypothetical protein